MKELTDIKINVEREPFSITVVRSVDGDHRDSQVLELTPTMLMLIGKLPDNADLEPLALAIFTEQVLRYEYQNAVAILKATDTNVLIKLNESKSESQVNECLPILHAADQLRTDIIDLKTKLDAATNQTYTNLVFAAIGEQTIAVSSTLN